MKSLACEISEMKENGFVKTKEWKFYFMKINAWFNADAERGNYSVFMSLQHWSTTIWTPRLLPETSGLLQVGISLFQIFF